MDLGFGGEVPDFYHQYRRGYPKAVFDTVGDAFRLTSDDLVIDLGCGTGQLSLPIAARVRAVLGVDPEPDMLARARRAAAEQGVTNVTWLLGADTDMPAVAALLGGGRAGVVTIGQALHWMDDRQLFPALASLLRPGGGVAVITNGTPLWLQDSAWSRALRGFLEEWLDTTLTNPCGTDEASQQRYRETMTAAGFDLTEASLDYTGELDLGQLVGGLYSAMRVPPPDQRAGFAERVRLAVAPHERFTEPVRVRMLLGRPRRGRTSSGETAALRLPGAYPPGGDELVATEPGPGPVIVLSYLHSGAEAVQEALAAGTTGLACTQATGIVPLCSAAVETWQRLENRPGRPVSRLAAASVRELVSTQMITLLSAGNGSRWCELAITSAAVAADFAQVMPAARFVCVHRSGAAVISAGAEAGRWGLAGQVPVSYIVSYPGNSAAALAAYWAESTQALLAFEAAHPQVCHRLRYEDVMADPQQALAAVSAALGLRPHPAGQHGAGPSVPVQETASVPDGKLPGSLRETMAGLHTELGYSPTG